MTAISRKRGIGARNAIEEKCLKIICSTCSGEKKKNNNNRQKCNFTEKTVVEELGGEEHAPHLLQCVEGVKMGGGRLRLTTTTKKWLQVKMPKNCFLMRKMSKIYPKWVVIRSLLTYLSITKP